MANKNSKRLDGFRSQLIDAALGIRRGVNVPAPLRMYDLVSTQASKVPQPNKLPPKTYATPFSTRYFGESMNQSDSEKELRLRIPKRWPYNKEDDEE